MGIFKTVMVLIPVSYYNSRKVCEAIENTKWDSTIGLRKHISIECENTGDDISFYDISDFMDAVNNQELDVLTEYFISYVQMHK